MVVLHDENSNNKFDRIFVGIPKEGYGVTNNPKPAARARPPPARAPRTSPPS